MQKNKMSLYRFLFLAIGVFGFSVMVAMMLIVSYWYPISISPTLPAATVIHAGNMVALYSALMSIFAIVGGVFVAVAAALWEQIRNLTKAGRVAA